MMKKILSFCLVGVMLFSLASCGSNGNQNVDESNGVEDTTTSIESEPIQEETPSPTPSDREPSEPIQSEEPTSSEDPIPSEEPGPSETPPTSSETPTQEPTSTPTPTPTQESTPPPTSTPTQVHTHSFSGGNCQTKSTCSTCGEVGDYGDHTWTTKEVYHEGLGHYETQEVTEQVIVGYEDTVYVHKCGDGSQYGGPYGCGFTTTDPDEMRDHHLYTGHGGSVIVKTGGGPIYETRTTTQEVWVEDTPAWTEYVTTCIICGARQ